jgi:hypothetical protein
MKHSVRPALKHRWSSVDASVVFQGYRFVTLDPIDVSIRIAGTRRFDYEKALDLPYTGRDQASAAQCKVDGSNEVTAEAQLKDIRETPSLAGCMKRIKIRACGEENYGDIGLRIP